MAAIAKISRPRLSGIHPRGQLFEQLDGMLAKGPVWVCGPPGAGKTTLVASYLDHRALKAIWIQIDAGDGDPASLFYYLGDAARRTGLAAVSHLPLLTPEYLPDLSGFIRRYIRRLCEALPRPYAIVLDNFHELPDGAPLQSLIAEILSEIPEDMSAFVVSRAAPPPSCARLLASRQLSELGWDDLRLTAEDGAQIAVKARGGTVAGIDTLLERCGGWVAGLTLLLEHQDAQGPAETPRTREALFDYFATELVDRLPPETRHVLLRTALLPWADAATAEALTGNPKASSILSGLRRRHLFTSLRAGAVPTYEYHALFREFLTARVKESYTVSEYQRLQHKSAQLLARTGQAEAAIQLYLEAGDHASAAEVILSEARSVAAQGRLQTVVGWIAALPISLVEETPWLVYWQAQAQIYLHPANAQKIFGGAFQKFENMGDTLGQVLAAIGVVEAGSLIYTIDSIDDHWLDILERLLAEWHFPDPDVELHAYGTFLKALYQSGAERARLKEPIERVTELIGLASDINARVRAAGGLISNLELMGDIRRIEALITRMAPLRDEPGLSPFLCWMWLTRQAFARAHVFGRWNEAMDLQTRALEIAQREGLFNMLPMAYLSVATLALMDGDLEGARRSASSAAPLIDEQAVIRGWYHGILLGIAVLENDGETVLLHEAPMRAQSFRADQGQLSLSVKLYTVYGRCVAGRYEEALEAAQEVESHVRRLNERGTQYDERIPAAYALLMLGREEEAAAVLRESLAVWASAGYVTTTLWVPAIMAQLYAFALERGIETAYVEHLIRLRGLSPPMQETEHWPWPVRIQTLGRFQILIDGKPFETKRKAPKKLLTFLKALIALGGENVPQQKLADALYPDHEGDVAEELIATAVLRSRKLLGDAKAITRSEGRLSLNPAHVWLDLKAFERTIQDPGATDKTLSLYGGAFLTEEVDAPWAVPTRERVERRLVRRIVSEATQFERQNNVAAATRLYTLGLEAAPLAEEFYQGLIRCYKSEQRNTEALAVYRQLEQALSSELSASPSPASQALYRTLQAS